MSADRYLVTGATGFVGANLVHRLVADGAAVFALVRPSSLRHRIADVADRITVVSADLTDATALISVLAEIKPTVVLHTAATGVYGGVAAPDAEVMRINLLGTVNLLAACADLPLRAFVNTGSSSEYGRRETPMCETDRPQPRDAYGASKCAATLYASTLGHRGRPVVTLRLFSPYGPRDDGRRFIPTAIAAALAGAAVPASDPAVGRDYVYIDDVVNAYQRAVERAAALAGAVINIGSGRQTTLREVADVIGRLVPDAAPPRWGVYPRSEQDSPCWQADIGQARQQLSWEPTVRLEEGLRRTITYIQETQNSTSSIQNKSP